MNKLIKSLGIFIIIALLSKVLGFFRETVTAFYFGTSIYLDAFLFASIIPVLLFDGIGAAVSTCVVPILSKNNIENKPVFLRTLNILLFGFLVILSLISILSITKILSIIPIGLGEESIQLVIKYSYFLIPSIILTGSTYIFMAYLLYKKIYSAANIMGIVNNLSIILSFFLFYKFLKHEILVYSWVLGSIMQLIVLYIFVRKYGYKPNKIFKLYPEHKGFLKLSVPVFFSSSVIQINMIVDRTLASTLPSGNISALNYAGKLGTLIIGTIVMALSSVVFPNLSKYWGENKQGKFYQLTESTIKTIILVMVPLVGFLFISSYIIVKIVFERGAFNQSDTLLTGYAFSFYCFAFLGLSIREILNKALFAMGDTKGPFWGTTVLVTFNIALGLIMVNLLGIAGLTLATAIANYLSVLTLIIWFLRKYSINPLATSKFLLLKTGVSTTLVSLIFLQVGIFKTTNNSILINLLILVSGFIIYFIFVFLLNILLKEKTTINFLNYFLKKGEING
ncbi:murein biosynthesis integral membrane protein MurJ [Neobacillus niacini]|uniref:murein biosynthesis integral membrane protein MurJ n=1 Tax=Neobacillus niacini TaxID=86668 RepID=UPI003B02C144